MGIDFWKKRNNLEKSLLALVGGLGVAVIFLLVVLMCTGFETDKDGFDEICMSPNCIKSAAQMISSMDFTADPCEDFYQYSCGGWIADNPVPEGRSVWGTFGKLDLQNQLAIKRILDNPTTVYKSEAEKKAKIYYDSCVDPTDSIERLGAKPLLNLLRSVGGWSVTGSFCVSDWSLQKTLQILHNEYNMGGLFSWAVGEDDKNSSRYIIQIDQGGLTLPARENYLNVTTGKRVLDAYLDFMIKVGVLLGGDSLSTKRKMHNIIQFETSLAGITKSEEEMRDEMKLYHLMSLEQLQKVAPIISWEEYFKSALKSINRPVQKEDVVVVRAPDYLRKLSVLLREYMKDDQGKTIVNDYLIWQTVRSLTSYLPKEFRDAHRGLRKALLGSDGLEEPELSCVTDTNNVLGFAVGAMFVRDVFRGDAKTTAQAMIDDVKAAFVNNLKHLDWMDDETRAAATNKANAITDMIGFPDFILQPDLLDKKYEDLVVKENDYFMNNIRVNQFNLRKDIEKLGKPVDKTRWNMSPSTVNAYYAPNKNQIVFPAGILRFPFFEVGNSDSLNFGSMGVVMGHELVHAFDDLGREYDQFGNMHKWWKNTTIEKFKEKADCVIRQYENYVLNGMHINGKQTLGENIADNGGLKAAFSAFAKRRSSASSRQPQLLPGLSLTPGQLFFVSFAQVWCSSLTDEAILLQIEKDPHSPSRFRVIGPLSNLKQFAEEFKCPKGSKMNPIDKCGIW